MSAAQRGSGRRPKLVGEAVRRVVGRDRGNGLDFIRDKRFEKTEFYATRILPEEPKIMLRGGCRRVRE
jgi:hypothetical protein